MASSSATAVAVLGGDDAGKRKREDERWQFSSRPRLEIRNASPSGAAADSPLHSPASSSGHFLFGASGASGSGTATNGAISSSSRSSTKVVRRRNIDRVHFGVYDIKTWYYSPYQFDDEEWASMTTSAAQEDTPRGGAHTVPTDALTGSKSGGALGDKAAALQSAPPSAAADEPPAKAIWVCDGCFKYMRTYAGFRAHKRDCRLTHPPGRKVYQRGAHTIWEVDGAQQKLYAQNLSLFGKLFIDHKTIYFDVEPFVFYVLTDATSSFDHVLGYFSKEKISYDDYNLACIISFPPFQKQGFGTLMIEFSYHLSSLTSVLGTPERPLSDLGLKGYLSFWSAVALRTLALFFNDHDADVKTRLLPSAFASSASFRGRHQAHTVAAAAALAEVRQSEESVRVRKILLGTAEQSDTASAAAAAARLARRNIKGWAGEVPKKRPTDQRHSLAPSSDDNSGDLSTGSIKHPLLDMPDEESSDHVPVTLHTTLDRLAEATCLRIDDLCCALAECDLLVQATADVNNDTAGAPLQLVITRDRVRKAIKQRNVKRPVLDVHYII